MGFLFSTQKAHVVLASNTLDLLWRTFMNEMIHTGQIGLKQLHMHTERPTHTEMYK